MDKSALLEVARRHGVLDAAAEAQLADYARLLEARRGAALQILVLGATPASLAMWEEYFGGAALLWGCTDEPLPASQPLPNLLYGDALDFEVERKLLGHGRQFDLVIDCGPAQLGDRQVALFLRYFARLGSGGLYLASRAVQMVARPPVLFDALAAALTQDAADAASRLTRLERAYAVFGLQADVAGLAQLQAIEPASTVYAIRKLTTPDYPVLLAAAKQAAWEAEIKLKQLQHLIGERDVDIAALRQSTSWRVTAPLRRLSGALQRGRRAGAAAVQAVRTRGGPYAVLKLAAGLYRSEGLSGWRRAVGALRGQGALDYAEWLRRYATISEVDRLAMRARAQALPRQPLISVLMPTYNSPPKFLDQAIRSVRRQLYPHWELCIADDASTRPEVRRLLERHSAEDARIKVVYRAQNGHISAASNSALELVSGEFVALFDHDDLLDEQALYRVAEAINAHPEAALIYSDEDKVDAANRRYDPYFKPDMNYELLLAHNLVCHLGVYRSDLVRAVGGFRLGYEGAQDYDLALRIVEQLAPAQVLHLPYVLYHWRAIAGSTALAPDQKNYAAEAGRRAVREHLARGGVAAEVMPAPELPEVNRVRFACPVPAPLVSILIPTRDRADLLGMCLDSLFERSTYGNYEVIIVDNGSVEEKTAQLFARLPKDRVRIVRDDSAFNFSALNNHAARLARGQFLCLMNNDIEIVTPGWLEEMVSFAARPGIGCVGARLWYPDGRLQHGGVVLGIGGIAGHAHKYLPRGKNGYFGRAVLHQAYSAVTAACLLLRRDVFEQVGGLDEQLAIAFNDVDFCLRVRAAGYRNVWTPYAEMIHHESASRGEEDSPEKIARFGREIAFVEARWGEQLRQDPAYNANLTLVHEDFSYAWPPRLASPPQQ